MLIQRAILLATILVAMVPALVRAEVAISNVPMWVTSGAEPNIMVMFDASGSMGTDLPREPVIYPGYSSTAVVSDYQICTKDTTSNKVRVCQGTGWETLTASNLGSAKALVCKNGAVMVKPIQAGASGVCMVLPSSLTIHQWNTPWYTYTVHYLKYVIGQKIAANANITSYFAWMPATTRLQAAKNVLIGADEKSGILAMTGVKFGFSRLVGSEGGRIQAACKSSSDMVSSTKTHNQLMRDIVSALVADGNTPLAESYYELTRYFRGLTPFWYSSSYGNAADDKGEDKFIVGTNGKYISPMNNYCEKNFVLILTDGYPTGDGSLDYEFPTNDPFDLATADRALPNWDNIKTDDPIINAGQPCDSRANRTFLPHSDGMMFQNTNAYACSNAGAGDEGSTLWLDDLALFGAQMDVKTDSDTDLKGRAYTGLQNIETYVVGLTVDNQMLKDTADYGNGLYSTTNSQTELENALRSAIVNIQSKVSSGSAVATNSSRLDTETTIYQARFSSEAWTGDLVAYKVNTDGSVASNPVWTTSSSSFRSWETRKVFSFYGGTGVDFNYASLNSAGATASLGVGSDAETLVRWVLGDATTEQRNAGPYRDRKTTLLGDIVDSDPAFVGPRMDFGLDLLPNTVTGWDTYRSFVNTNKSNKNFKSMLYVGANDGMLHAFDAKDGSEVFAYIPSEMLPRLTTLSKPDYKHENFVDGSPFVGHAYINGAWRTILIGSTGLGGRTIFALDVSDPANFTKANVLWEYQVPANVGYLNGPPILAPLANGKWGVIFGNGYASGSSHAKLIVLDASDGSEIKVLDTGVGSSTAPNGLSGVTVVPNGSRQITTVYGGDLQGNLWKFDISNGNQNQWKVAYNGAPLFKAVGSDGKFQSITGGITLTPSSKGGYMVLFGSGKYIESTDGNAKTDGGDLDKDLQIQSFYGIWDNGTAVVPDGFRSASSTILQKQSITTTSSTSRQTSTTSYAGDRGWYIDLAQGTAVTGERVTMTPVVRSGRVVFFSIVPSPDPCGAGGTGWLYEMGTEDGKAFNTPVFDWNNDGKIDSSDGLANVKMLSDLPSGITVITTGGGIEYKYSSGSSATLSVTGELSDVSSSGRSSWRQLK